MKDSVVVTISDGFETIKVLARHGEILLDIIRKSGMAFAAPCGGKGTCNKCLVQVKGEGEVLACRYIVEKPICVSLHPVRDGQIVHDAKSTTVAVDVRSGISIRNDVKRTVYYYNEILFQDEGSSANILGLAVDVGTTTVAIYLEDLVSGELVDTDSFINPQSAFGADVISRVSYCIENENGVQKLCSVLVDAMNESIEKLCRRNELETFDIFKITMVGNTVMLHILCGVNPAPIAFAPYTPVFTEGKRIRSTDLNLVVHPKAVIEILPSIAGYVGADIVAGVAATDILSRSDYCLYIDIGTNGEMVLGNRDNLFCCATAAGPAFEGANISCGVGGVSGAVSEYTEREFAVIGGGKAIGICGSALIDVTAVLLDNKRISADGYMDGDFQIVAEHDSKAGRAIVLTPQDVRQVQLAKAAIYAGIQILIEKAGISAAEIKTCYLAGGFGNYIRKESAVRIGLLPAFLQNKIVVIGNSAGLGARNALKSFSFTSRLDEVIKKAYYIELSMNQHFTEAYVSAMSFQD